MAATCQPRTFPHRPQTFRPCRYATSNLQEHWTMIDLSSFPGPQQRTTRDQWTKSIVDRLVVLHPTAGFHYLMKMKANYLSTQECVPLPESDSIGKRRIIAGMTDVKKQPNTTVAQAIAKCHNPLIALVGQTPKSP